MKRGRPQNKKRRMEIFEYLEKGLKNKEIMILTGISKQLLNYYKKELSTGGK